MLVPAVIVVIVVEMALASMLLLQRDVQTSFHALGGIYIALVVALISLALASTRRLVSWGFVQTILAITALLSFMTAIFAASVHIPNGEYLILTCGAHVLTSLACFVIDIVKLATRESTRVDV